MTAWSSGRHEALTATVGVHRAPWRWDRPRTQVDRGIPRDGGHPLDPLTGALVGPVPSKGSATSRRATPCLTCATAASPCPFAGRDCPSRPGTTTTPGAPCDIGRSGLCFPVTSPEPGGDCLGELVYVAPSSGTARVSPTWSRTRSASPRRTARPRVSNSTPGRGQHRMGGPRERGDGDHARRPLDVADPRGCGGRDSQAQVTCRSLLRHEPVRKQVVT